MQRGSIVFSFNDISITPDTACRLARFFETTLEFWLGLQTDVNLWDTLEVHRQEYERIKPLETAAKD